MVPIRQGHFGLALPWGRTREGPSRDDGSVSVEGGRFAGPLLLLVSSMSLFRVSISTHLQPPHVRAAGLGGGWGLWELQVTTLFSLSYSSSFSSGDPPLPLRLLTGGAGSLEEVGGHLGGKRQKFASSWDSRDPSPREEWVGQEGWSQGCWSCLQPHRVTSQDCPGGKAADF